MTALQRMASAAAGRRESVPALCPLWLEQAVKFGAVGVLNTAVDVGLYLVLTRWLGVMAAWRMVAKGVSYAAGVVNSFYWNRSWTFRSRASARTAFAPFAVSNVIGLVVNAGALQLCLGVFRLDEWPALIMATGSALLWNFAASKYLIFRTPRRAAG